MSFPGFLALVAALGVVLSLLSVRLRSVPVSAPLVALVVGGATGPSALDVISFSGALDTSAAQRVVRLVLAIALMGAALRFPLSELRRDVPSVGVLLGAVLPVSAAVGTVLAAVVGGLRVPVAVVVGAALAPTDPVLAGGTVSGRNAETQLPQRVRRLLVVESGLNDGLALPLVLLGIELATHRPLGADLARWAPEAAYEVAVGVLLGLAVGVGVGRLLRHQTRFQVVERAVETTLPLALALLVVALCRLAGSDGLLGVFVAGIAYRAVYSDERAGGTQRDVADGLNRLLILVVFFGLGLLVPWSAFGNVRTVALAVAVLALRRLPVVLAFRMAIRLPFPEAAFVGWFGPVGVSAVYYWALASRRGVLPDDASSALLVAVVLSAIAYAVSGPPGLRAYARVRRRDTSRRSGAD